MFLKSTFLRLALCATVFLSLLCVAQVQNANNALPTRIDETVTPLTIDGKLDDVAWKQSIAVSDFSITGSKTLAVEFTQVRSLDTRIVS